MRTSRPLLVLLGTAACLLGASLWRGREGVRPEGKTTPAGGVDRALDPSTDGRPAGGEPLAERSQEPLRAPIERSLAGRVVDEEGVPIVSAEVSCGDERVSSDSDGRFLIEGPAGTRSLRVAKVGYLPLETRVEPSAEELGDLVLRRIAFTIEGIVRGPNGQVATGAHVSLEWTRAARDATKDALLDALFSPEPPGPPPLAETTADEQGAFRLDLDEIPAASIAVRAVDERGEGGCAVESGRSTRTVFVAIDLTALAPLAGRVVDGNGDGLADLAVVIAPYLSSPEEAADALTWRRSTVTGSDGRFRFPGVRERPGSLAVLVPDGPRELLRFQAPFDQELTVVVEEGGTLPGKVLDAETRRPIAGAHVSALVTGRSSSRVTWATAESDTTGRFELTGLPPGPVESLIVRHPDYPPAGTMLMEALPIPVVLAPPAATQPIEVPLRKGVALEAVVRAPDGSLVEDALVSLDGHGALVRAEARTDPAGHVRFGGLLPGPYLLDVESTAGVLPVDRRLLTIAADTPPQLLDLLVPVRVTGSVVSARNTPLPGVSLVLRALARNGAGAVATQRAFSDPSGRFEFAGLAPGTAFEIQATLEGHPGGTEVGFVDVGDVVQDVGAIVVTEGAEVLGHVVDQNGAAVEGAEVHVLRSDALMSSPASTWTDAQGAFSLVGLAPGSVQVAVTLEGCLTAFVPSFELAPDEKRADLLVKLVRGGSLQGSAVDESGRPVAGADVIARWVPMFDDDELSRTSRLQGEKIQGFCQARAVTSPGGVFLLEGLPGDRPMQIQVMAAGYAPAVVIAQPPALGGSEELSVELRRTDR